MTRNEAIKISQEVEESHPKDCSATALVETLIKLGLLKVDDKLMAEKKTVIRTADKSQYAVVKTDEIVNALIYAGYVVLPPK